MSVITLTTDFGTGSPYVAAMKGVMLSINPDVTIVDITHAVPPRDVRQGAMVLEQVAGRFPAESIHLAVVDPGVGSGRTIVYARIGRQHFIAPDNGLLSGPARNLPPESVIAVTNRQFWLENVSATFHGRDIMAPVAAHLSRGVPPAEFGPSQTELMGLDWPEVKVHPGRITGAVLSIDSFGNLITNITSQMLEEIPHLPSVTIHCGSHQTEGIQRTYADRPSSTLVALIGSGDYLELAVVEGNAAQRLGASVDEPVMVRW